MSHKKEKSFYVYVIRLKDHKHYYVGSTGNLKQRLIAHSNPFKCRNHGSNATRAYGFSGLPTDIRVTYKCRDRAEARSLELQVASMYRELFPDVPICGDYYSFGTRRYNDLD
jgi:predicted GIY-YIG superfamily endonuclease